MSLADALPPYVHRKTAKGRTYYYFALGFSRGEGATRLIRLPDITHPSFERRVSELQTARGVAPKTRGRFRTKGRPMVYFIGAGHGPIKIGVSCEPEARCREMQIGAPDDFEVLAKVAGGHQLEKAYHRRFGFARKRGEWFERDPLILAEIERLNALEQEGNKGGR